MRCNCRSSSSEFEKVSRQSDHFGKGERREIGAYVWARCGFEFETTADAFAMMLNLTEYKVRNNITSERGLYSDNRPVDFATLKGEDKAGNIVPLGKDFLLNSNIQWKGVRDLKLDSPGTKDFIEYLKEKGRMDLVEKYFKE